MMSSNPKLEAEVSVERLCASYRRHKSTVFAVKDVSFSFPRGSVFGVLGANGAGKSTLLSCLQGTHSIDSGSISVFGLDVASSTAQVKGMLGVQLQRTALLEGLNAVELLQTYAAFYNEYPSEQKVLTELDRFGVASQAKKRVRAMSGGQQQAVALAVAFITDAEIRVLDEPTEALDPVARRNVWSIVRDETASGRTVLITTHSMEEAQALCDKVVIMKAGEIVGSGSPSELASAVSAATVTVTTELAIDLVRMIRGVTAVDQRGDRMSIRCTDAVAVVAALHRLSKESGESISHLKVDSGSLEEAYVNLMGSRSA